MSQTRERYFEWTLLGLILIIGALLFYEGLPFLNGALGAVTLYLLLRRTNIYLCTRFSRGVASWLITLSVTCFVMVPLSALLWYLIDIVQNVDFDIQGIIQRFTDTIKYLEQTTGLDIASERTVSFLTGRATAIMNMFMSGINNTAINLFTAILLLFFLLSGGMKMERTIARCLPFSDNNKRLIISKVSTIVRSNAIGIPLLAIIQGGVAALGYSLCGINRPIEFGILTGFASMIPIVGSMLVWIPLTILQYFEHGLMPAVYIAAYGIVIISQCDNVLRMIVQKRMANTHPLITIFGVIVGLPLFGFMGLIFGPLLVAMFMLFLELFVNQYIIGDNDPEKAIVSTPKSRRKERLSAVMPLTSRFKRQAAAAQAAKDLAPAAPIPPTVPADSVTTEAERVTPKAAPAIKPNAKRPNHALEQKNPKAKNFKNAKAQSKQEKRENAKQRAAQNKAALEEKTKEPAPAKPQVVAPSGEPKSEVKPEVKPEVKAEVKAEAMPQPEHKPMPERRKEQERSRQPRHAVALNAAPVPPKARIKPDAKKESMPYKDLGQSTTVRALRSSNPFLKGAADNPAYGQSLVARAVSQAIGAFDNFDDLDGHLGPSANHPVDMFKPAPSAKSEDKPAPKHEKSKESAPHTDRPARRERKHERGPQDKAPEAKEQSLLERAQKAKPERNKDQAKSQHLQAERGKAEPKPGVKPNKQLKPGKKAPERGSKAMRDSKVESRGSARRSTRGGRSRRKDNNLDYQVLRPTRAEPAPILHTIVSRSAGLEPERPRSALRTQLVSLHTAKGTMLAEAPRRKPSKRRPYH